MGSRFSISQEKITLKIVIPSYKRKRKMKIWGYWDK